MPPAEFEPAIPAGERLQTHALDRSATGIGIHVVYRGENVCWCLQLYLYTQCSVTDIYSCYIVPSTLNLSLKFILKIKITINYIMAAGFNRFNVKILYEFYMYIYFCTNGWPRDVVIGRNMSQ